MKILIFGGTTEGRILSRALADAGAEVTVCVATEYGSEQQGNELGIKVCTGPLTQEEKLELLTGQKLCVDATHPYATHISASVRDACRRASVPCLRLKREKSDCRSALEMESAEAAADWLRTREGNVLLTTGSREVAAFRNLDPKRLFPRVLPTRESLSACEAMGIPRRNIIAMYGPFSEEMNTATIRQYDIRYLVTKDGGAPGGYPEKAAAAEKTGTVLLVLSRPCEDGMSYEEILKRCMTALEADANIDGM